MYALLIINLVTQANKRLAKISFQNNFKNDIKEEFLKDTKIQKILEELSLNNIINFYDFFNINSLFGLKAISPSLSQVISQIVAPRTASF